MSISCTSTPDLLTCISYFWPELISKLSLSCGLGGPERQIEGENPPDYITLGFSYLSFKHVGRLTVNNQASFVKQFLGDSSFFYPSNGVGLSRVRWSYWSLWSDRGAWRRRVLTSSVNTGGSSGWCWLILSLLLSLLGEVVQSPHEVQHLHHVQSTNLQAGPGHVVRVVHAVTEPVRQGCTRASHEVVEEVVHKFDDVHDSLGALDDLPVKRGLDIALQSKNGLRLNICVSSPSPSSPPSHPC